MDAREGGRRVHQAYSNLEHVVAQGEVGEGIPGGSGTLLKAGEEAGLVVVFEARHLGRLSTRWGLCVY